MILSDILRMVKNNEKIDIEFWRGKKLMKKISNILILI